MMNMKKKILIVDDEQDVRIFLKYNLEKSGYDVLTATDGKDALKQIQSNEPDLIISDIMMPELNGLSMMKVMQQQDINHIPIIFLTASSDELHYISALLAGCYDFLNKPISLTLLMQKINEVFYERKEIKTGTHD